MRKIPSAERRVNRTPVAPSTGFFSSCSFRDSILLTPVPVRQLATKTENLPPRQVAQENVGGLDMIRRL
jgi:hypothetical protein